MSCASIYAWISQSTNHTQFALQHFPLVASMVLNSRGENDFYDTVNQLTVEQEAQYHGEMGEWQKLYGSAWEKTGCAPERFVAEHSDAATQEGPAPTSDQPHKEDVARIQRALVARGISLQNTSGLWDSNTCEACYKFKRDVLHHHSSKLDEDFFLGLGFSEKVSQSYATMFGDMCVEWYAMVVEPTAKDISAIQQALMNYGYNPGSTDGVLSARTCDALRAFQHAKTGSSSDIIGADTFHQLGFSRDYATVLAEQYGTICAAKRGDVGLYTNIRKEAEPVNVVAAPQPPTRLAIQPLGTELKKAGKSVLPVVGFGLALVGVGVYLTGDKRSK